MPSPGCPPAADAGATVARAARTRATVPPFAVPGPGPALPRRAFPCSCGGGYRAVSTRGSGPGVKPVSAWGGADLTWREEVRVDACGPGREASPPRRPAAGGSVPSATVRRECAVGHRPGSRARSCRASSPAGPGRPPGQASPPTRPLLLSCFPAAPGRRPPWPAGRGPDLTGRAERSVRRRGPTDGPHPGTQTAPGRPAATPGGAPGTADDPLLTIDEVIAELRVSRAAFYRWRRQGAGPPAVRLPGGGVRVRRSALTAWLRRLEQEDMQ
jgi:excisionase family DNA binding protein